MLVTGDKERNLKRAGELVREASRKGARLIVLPEFFVCPLDLSVLPDCAEEIQGKISTFLSELAKETGSYLVGGSFPEREGERLYNTSLFYSPEGIVIAKHRKIHLFDVDIKGGISFQESKVLDSGEETTVVETELGRIGIGICYDIRFPELWRKMVLQGAEMFVVPAAFNMTTGPAHWHLLMRTRALDNQVYLAVASPARDEFGKYVAYGHSLGVDPFGKVVVEADIGEEIVYMIVDRERIEKVREQLPVLRQRRPEVY